jgi:hypothetical protein
MSLYACLTCVSSDYTKTGELLCLYCINEHKLNTNHISKEYENYNENTKCAKCMNQNEKKNISTCTYNEISNDYYSRDK